MRLKFEINSVVLQDVVCGGSEASIVPVPTSFAAKSPVWRHTVLYPSTDDLVQSSDTEGVFWR